MTRDEILKEFDMFESVEDRAVQAVSKLIARFGQAYLSLPLETQARIAAKVATTGVMPGELA
jgi:hypothetical protein